MFFQLIVNQLFSLLSFVFALLSKYLKALKMRYKAIYFFILLVIGLALVQKGNAQSPIELMGTANDLYQEGNLDEALKLYQQIEAMDYESAQLYHNLGTTWLKSNHLADYLPQSILAFERGLRLKPKDIALQNNLDFAKEDITFRADAYPDIFYKRYLKNTIKSLAAWKWLALAVLFAWLILWMFYRFLYARKRIFFFGGIALVCMLSLIHI